jgi:hypothetical protein
MTGYVPWIPWTPEKIADLTRMWVVEKLPASVIAERLGMTRNAIVGKVFRLKLSSEGHATNGGGAPKGPRKIRPIRSTPFRPPVSTLVSTLSPPEEKKMEGPPVGGVPLLELENWHCREIIGHNGLAVFCGATQCENSSFCPTHHAKNYTFGTGWSRK